MMSATAVFERLNLLAIIPNNICCGVAVSVLYNNNEFVIPYDVKILFIIVSRV